MRTKNSSPYSGRPTSEANAYFYQGIQVLAQAEAINTTKSANAWAIIGYPTDAGVMRNLGRPGAAAGPAAIRERLGREPWHAHPELQIVDCGDLQLEENSVEQAQLQLGASVALARSAGYRTLVLGGGHDLAFGHFLGLRFALDSAGQAKQRLGIINFDAHLDLRPLEDGRASSGTPFTQVAQHCASLGLPFDYCCYGAQHQANTPALWAFAKTTGAAVIPLSQQDGERHHAAENLMAFAQTVDALYITVDLDGFPSYVSPGVSAPGVDGLRYREVLSHLRQLLASGRVLGLDFAECNPTYDLDGRTARLAARLIAELLSPVID